MLKLNMLQAHRDSAFTISKNKDLEPTADRIGEPSYNGDEKKINSISRDVVIWNKALTFSSEYRRL
jgi:hypothetical protein